MHIQTCGDFEGDLAGDFTTNFAGDFFGEGATTVFVDFFGVRSGEAGLSFTLAVIFFTSFFVTGLFGFEEGLMCDLAGDLGALTGRLTGVAGDLLVPLILNLLI